MEAVKMRIRFLWKNRRTNVEEVAEHQVEDGRQAAHLIVKFWDRFRDQSMVDIRHTIDDSPEMPLYNDLTGPDL